MKPSSFTLLAALTFFSGVSVQAASVFECINESGKKVFQDRPCRGVLSLPPGKKAVAEVDAELSRASLQGVWLITHVGTMSAEEMGVGEDLWEFKGDAWTVISNDRRLAPEKFTIINNKIDFGSYSIKVTYFNGITMTTTFSGIVQRLVKR